MRATVTNLERRQDKVEQALDELDEKYVPHREFEAASQHVQESLKRIEVSVRKLTEYLLERPGHKAPRIDSDL
jgi:hypothetical protein